MRLGSFFVFLLVLLNSCATSRPSPAQTTIASEQASSSKPVILSLILKANWNTDSSVRFTVYNDIRNEGRLKKQNLPYNPAFIAYFTDASGNKKDSCYFEHPLRERIEGENDQNKLSTTVFVKEEAFKTLRINFTMDMTQVVLLDLKTKYKQTITLK